MAALAVLLLTSAGDDTPDETRGDLTYIEGSRTEPRKDQEPLVASIADLNSADVVAEEDALVFGATVAAPVPQPLKTSALEFRWDISGEDGASWTLSVAVAKESHASLFSQGGYGSGTVDGTFPGELNINDRTIDVRLEAAGVEDFPEAFEWSVSTTLRAFRNETDSPRVEDRYPDKGVRAF